MLSGDRPGLPTSANALRKNLPCDSLEVLMLYLGTTSWSSCCKQLPNWIQHRLLTERWWGHAEKACTPRREAQQMLREAWQTRYKATYTALGPMTCELTKCEDRWQTLNPHGDATATDTPTNVSSTPRFLKRRLPDYNRFPTKPIAKDTCQNNVENEAEHAVRLHGNHPIDHRELRCQRHDGWQQKEGSCHEKQLT